MANSTKALAKQWYLMCLWFDLDDREHRVLCSDVELDGMVEKVLVEYY